MKYFKQWLCVMVVACAGCSGGSDNRQGAVSPPTSTTTDFTNFVIAQYVTGASETAAPVNVEPTTFTFADDDNPNAFDFIISTAP